MRMRPWIGVTLMAALAACTASPQMGVQAPPVVGQQTALQGGDGIPVDRQIYTGRNTFRLLAVEELPIVGVTASSTTSGYAASRAIDGNLATQWVDGGYRNATSWLTVELASTATIGSIDIKTGISPAGTSFDVQVSSDGTSWTTVRTGLTNTTWNLENKTVPAGTTGKFVRILWKNSPTNPQPHFSIFELGVNGESGSTATPTPVTSATPTPVTTASPTTPPSGSVTKVNPTSVTASSTYSGLTPQRATDGNLSTQWANGGYREASAWLNLAFGSTQTFSSLRIKTGALPAGVSYRAEVSNDGTNWTAASGNLTNSTWNMESKAISGTGKFLRIRFTNSTSAPIARFSVYEVEAFASAPAPALQCETVSIGGEIYEPGSAQDAPPTHYLNLGVSKHDETAFGSFGSFSLSYATASGFFEGVAFSSRIEGDVLTVNGTATAVDNFGRVYVGEWVLEAQIERGVDNTFGGKVTALTVGGEVVEIDPNRAPTVSGIVGDCAPDPRNCFSIADDTALLFPSEGSNEPHGELLINSLTRTASGTSGSVTFSGYDGRPSFTGTIQGALFSGDTITFGGPITDGGNFTFSGIVHGYEVSEPEHWAMAPLTFKATDAAGNPIINIEPGTIQPSLTGGYAVRLGCN